jgi:hypothetical protein
MLTLRAGSRSLRIGLPGEAGRDGRVCGQLPIAAIPEAAQWDWPGLEMLADFGAGPQPVATACATVRDAGGQTGHVGGLDAAGRLCGWSAAPGAAPGTELPVRVRAGQADILGMTGGAWRETAQRGFRIPLPGFLPLAEVVALRVTGGLDRSRPFSRELLYAGLTPCGVLQAAPVGLLDGIATGAMQIAGLGAAPLRLSLRQGDQVTPPCLCNRDSHPDYDFNGQACGFFIRMPEGFAPDTTRIVLTHPGLPGPLDYPMRAFRPEPRDRDTDGAPS